MRFWMNDRSDYIYWYLENLTSSVTTCSFINRKDRRITLCSSAERNDFLCGPPFPFFPQKLLHCCVLD
jgi:hypothetical protein